MPPFLLQTKGQPEVHNEESEPQSASCCHADPQCEFNKTSWDFNVTDEFKCFTRLMVYLALTVLFICELHG